MKPLEDDLGADANRGERAPKVLPALRPTKPFGMARVFEGGYGWEAKEAIGVAALEEATEGT